jgi:Flp pilus assembly protein TadG
MITHSNKKKSERGQAFMELALSLVFLLVLLTVMVDLGWAFYTLIAMRDTVQEAAAYGSMCPQDPNLVETRLRKSAVSPLDISAVPVSDINIEYLKPDGTPVTGAIERGDSIKITLNYNHKIIVPFVATFIGMTEYPLHVTVADTILRNDNFGCD